MDHASWRLALEQISSNEADDSIEAEFWTAEAALGEDWLYLDTDSVGGLTLELERVQ